MVILTELEVKILYEKAMKDDQVIPLVYTKILALGPGQVGKSTFLYRLIGLMKGNIEETESNPELKKTLPQGSTGTTEYREACITYNSTVGALTSDRKWCMFVEGSELELKLEPQLKKLLSLITIKAENKPTSSESEPDSTSYDGQHLDQNPEDSEERAQHEDVSKERTQHEDVSEKRTQHEDSAKEKGWDKKRAGSPKSDETSSSIGTVLQQFHDLQNKCLYSKEKDSEKQDILLNVCDVGGQPAFLDMLPSLTIGPALYLIFLKLSKGLKTQYPVLFKCKDERGEIKCKNYTYTSEEVIFTALSSIACFGNIDPEVERRAPSVGRQKSSYNSLVQLVGTFYDKEKDDAGIQSQIHKLVAETDFYKEGLLHSTHLLKVDNRTEKKEKMWEHRSRIEDLLINRFHAHKIPARWLMFSICLKLLSKEFKTFTVSFKDCVIIGDHFKMSERMVRAALIFLHKYVGLVMYFPTHQHLKNYVICDPQVVFSKVSELIFDIYDPKNCYVDQSKRETFVLRGRFSPDDIKKKDFQSDILINLLVHLNIAAEVPDVKNADRKEYILPAVLQTAENSLLEFKRGENDEVMPEPLCICCNTGYLPMGFVCALSAKLIGHKNFELVYFEVSSQNGSQYYNIAYKNKIMFRYNGTINIVMVSSPKYCEFWISRYKGGGQDFEFWDSNCCPCIKKAICEAADEVFSSMRHGSHYTHSKSYELAFKCPKSQNTDIGHEPLAKFNKGPYEVPTKLKCLKQASGCGPHPLTKEMKIWLGEVRNVCLYVCVPITLLTSRI